VPDSGILGLQAEEDVNHLLIMGGPLAIYEIHRYGYLVNEALLADRAIKSGRYVLGVCLGAQMIAHALGARVYPGSRKETGRHKVTLTAEGMHDPILPVLALPGKNKAEVFQLHVDTFDLPAGAERLVSSGPYPNQALTGRTHSSSTWRSPLRLPAIVSLPNRGLIFPLLRRIPKEFTAPIANGHANFTTLLQKQH